MAIVNQTDRATSPANPAGAKDVCGAAPAASAGSSASNNVSPADERGAGGFERVLARAALRVEQALIDLRFLPTP